MAILLDASIVLAATDRADLNHAAAMAWFDRADEPLLLAALTLADLDTLLQRELGPSTDRGLSTATYPRVRPRTLDASIGPIRHGSATSAPRSPESCAIPSV